MHVATGTERKVVSASGRVDAPSWGPGGQLLYHVSASGQSRFETEGQGLTGNENVFAFRASWAGPTDFFYVADGHIRQRTLRGGDAQTIPFTATLPVTKAHTAYVPTRDFTSTAPRQVLGIVRPVLCSMGSRSRLRPFGIYVAGRRHAGEPHLRPGLDTDPAWSLDGTQLACGHPRTATHSAHRRAQDS